MKNIIIPGAIVLAAAAGLIVFGLRNRTTADPAQGTPSPGTTSGVFTGGSSGSGGAGEPYAVKTTLKELFRADPEKGIGVYGRYTELSAEGQVPEALSRVLAETNDRARKNVEERAEYFLAENSWPVIAGGSAAAEGYRYRNISCIVNITRADSRIFSVLETELESGIGAAVNSTESSTFRAAVYDTQSGRKLALSDFLQDPGSLGEHLKEALLNKYAVDGLYAESGETAPAWTADYLGLRFYFDGTMILEEKKQEAGISRRKAVHVSIPYTALDGPMAETAAAVPGSFIAQLEKSTWYALPGDGKDTWYAPPHDGKDARHALPRDSKTIRIEKAADENGRDAYRLVIKEGTKEEALWLEYADDASDFYIFRSGGSCYFYRLEENEDRGYVYNFAQRDGGYGRFANQNAQCFDSFLHELQLAVPFNSACVHMREQTRRFMNPVSGLNTAFSPTGHYSFLPEPGRGRTWLHFALIDDALALDTRNVGCRLLHEVRAVKLDGEGKEAGETVIPAGEVLRFLSVDGESELYYYMAPQSVNYKSDAGNYLYDCQLSDGSMVRLAAPYENSLFVDGMYMERIGTPVTLGEVLHGAWQEAGPEGAWNSGTGPEESWNSDTGPGGVPEHYVEIGGKTYQLIQDLSKPSEVGEEIDFAGDIWWKVENYVGTFTSEEQDATLVISENGEVRFTYEGTEYTGTLPEKRYYRSYPEIHMEAGYERRTFRIIVTDDTPWHDPSFREIRFYSEGEPATNEPSKVPPIEVLLTRAAS